MDSGKVRPCVSGLPVTSRKTTLHNRKAGNSMATTKTTKTTKTAETSAEVSDAQVLELLDSIGPETDPVLLAMRARLDSLRLDSDKASGDAHESARRLLESGPSADEDTRKSVYDAKGRATKLQADLIVLEREYKDKSEKANRLADVHAARALQAETAVSAIGPSEKDVCVTPNHVADLLSMGVNRYGQYSAFCRIYKLGNWFGFQVFPASGKTQTYMASVPKVLDLATFYMWRPSPDGDVKEQGSFNQIDGIMSVKTDEDTVLFMGHGHERRDASTYLVLGFGRTVRGFTSEGVRTSATSYGTPFVMTRETWDKIGLEGEPYPF